MYYLQTTKLLQYNIITYVIIEGVFLIIVFTKSVFQS